MMTDSNESFDLPRWQTHIDPLSSTAQAAHAAQSSYYTSNLPPPPPSSSMSPTSPQRLNATHTGPSRQPRISQLMEEDQQMALANSGPYTPNQLSRSASLNSGAGPTSRNRRHHQPEDLEGAFNSDGRHQNNTLYNPSIGYQPQSLSATASAVTSPNSPGENAYGDMYYGAASTGTGNPMGRVQSTPEASSTRGNRSPLRGPNTPNSATLLDPYSQQQAQYSPSANSYPYAPPPPPPPYQSHSRNHSQQVKTESLSPSVSSSYHSQQPSVKTESLSPSLSSPYTPQGPGMYPSQSYAMDTSSPQPQQQQQQQSRLTAPPAVRKNSASNPSTPLSYLHPSQGPSSYYPQDQPMAVDTPPKREGFRRVRTAHDLQPRLDIPSTGRRMGSDGSYLSPLHQLTTNIVETYRICNPQFRYESALNPRRVLTKPSKPVHNEGYDNEDYDYILYVNDWLGTEEGHKYLILDILGQGTFGQVVKCQNMKTHEIVAVKVVKNKPAYFNQSMMEVTILELLNKQCDPNDEHHILRLRDSFIHRSHLCLVFELLSSNLYELIKQNQFQGLSTQLVKVFMAQLLDAMTVLKEARLIHCDLKPENILLKSLQSPQIKVIDFGSACHERQTVYTYIQSRFYRSPEVLLGMSYTASIDMWSLGCIAVELFLGLPLFPGTSEYNQLTRIVEMLGMPPLSMLNTGKQTSQFFDSYETWNPHLNQNEKRYRLKSLEQYSREHGTNEQPGKQYFKATSLPEIINTAPMPATKSSNKAHEVEKEMNNRASFIDFCKGLLDLNPVTRWTPQQARLHPFITGEKFTRPFVPDNLTPQQQQASTPNSSHSDPKRPYGGLVPSQPKGARAYQDAASYNQHLAQHQVYTAQAQSQAANTLRNPYISPPAQQQSSSYSSHPEQAAPPYPQAQPYTHSGSSGHRLTHQSSTGQLTSSNSHPQYSGHSSSSSGGHLNPNSVGSGSYYPNSRGRANTINQMDTVPPALARLQHMNQDVIAGRNALTPVLNRDDAMREWERRQAGKTSAAQPYPQLEFLQQQAELAASGVTSWANPPQHRYQAAPSKLSHSYQPAIMVDDDQGRRDAVMSNVRSAARTDGSSAALYGAAGVISNPPQAYTSNNTTSGNRYATTYPQQQPQQQSQQAQQPSAFDSLERRTDIGNIYVPMQPDHYSGYSNQSSSSARHVPPPQQAVPPSFYGAGVVPPGSSAQPPNNRNLFDNSQAPAKDGRRGSGMDLWPR